MPTLVKSYVEGNNLVAEFDDGSIVRLYRSINRTWVNLGGGGGGTDPETPVGSGTFISPFDIRPSSEGGAVSPGGEYGPRTGGAGSFHEGIDFGYPPALSGADIHAIGDGVVQLAGWHAKYGNHLIIDHGRVGDKVIKSLYAHMIAPALVNNGVNITKGQLVGNIGNTGGSQGAHLHLETHVCGLDGQMIWNLINNSDPRTAVNPREFFVTYA